MVPKQSFSYVWGSGTLKAGGSKVADSGSKDDAKNEQDSSHNNFANNKIAVAGERRSPHTPFSSHMRFMFVKALE